MIFTNKFKIGDKVICIKKQNKYANMQLNDTGRIIEVEEDWKKYNVKISNKRPGNNKCCMRENELAYRLSRKEKQRQDIQESVQLFLRNRLKLIKQRARSNGKEM